MNLLLLVLARVASFHPVSLVAGYPSFCCIHKWIYDDDIHILGILPLMGFDVQLLAVWPDRRHAKYFPFFLRIVLRAETSVTNIAQMGVVAYNNNNLHMTTYIGCKQGGRGVGTFYLFLWIFFVLRNIH